LTVKVGTGSIGIADAKKSGGEEEERVIEKWIAIQRVSKK